MPPPLPPPLPPPRPPRPVTGRSISNEKAPVTDLAKIGIELEGVGWVKTNWNAPITTSTSSFHSVFKRTALVRSPSYGDLRGVYIAPEDGEFFGRHSPAELVSQPHQLNATGVINLRNSLWKAIRKREFSRGQAPFLDPRRAPAAHPPVATSSWQRTAMPRVSGSLQTTIGVQVARMLSDDEAVRQRVSGLLVGDPEKRTRFDHLTKAAVCAERYLTAPGALLERLRNRPDGVRLALFMAFLVPAMPDEAKGWAKDYYGCNVKAESSFLACGISEAELPLTAGIIRRGSEAVENELLLALLDADVEPWIVNGLLARLNVTDIGKPGQSVQTSVERWYSIPNFLVNGHLCCVVEVREKSAPLNSLMVEFLNATEKGGLPQPFAVVPPWLQSKARAFVARLQADLMP